jgi:Rps23 Pro-64 3,4-dihydroxylase Tpa1-like proline 4-hydroxylase
VQLSIYGGNGSFYIAHRDGVTGSFVQLGLLQWLKLKCYRLRVVTAILYLNESEPRTWNQASDGGSLRLYIGADKGDTLGDTAEDIVDVLPIGGRLVLFDSQQVLHEVRPVYRERIAITCWLTCPG